MKDVFFVEVEKTTIFDKDKFIDFVTNKQFLPDSYTAFKNKVGLTAGDEFLKENKRVVLAWPYKDTILEGGQTKADSVRDEVFWNQTLAPDQISRLLDQKVFTNAKRIDAKGEHKFDKFNTDQKGDISDNLIIRSNNLLALHSLKKRFAGRVKLIYIDPPYNTDGDDFHYNDRFNHSTWLTFMKNRLEVAQELLSNDGVIFVQIDYIEFAYLKVLMDEVFGADKALPHVTIKTATPAGFKVINPGFINVSEELLVYVKTDKNVIKPGFTITSYQSDYSKYIVDRKKSPAKWEIVSIKDAALSAAGYKSLADFKKSVGEKASGHLLDEIVADFALKNADNVFATYGPHKPTKSLQKAIEASKQKPDVVIEIERSREDSENYYLLNGRLLAFYSSKLREVDGELTPTQRLTDFWDDISWDSLSGEGGVTLKNGKKPEKLLKRIIELTTEKGDLVLDFHLGSGTTAAVAHKLGRQFIGIEQLDYGDDDSVARLKNVINGEQSGVSKAANWRGGGNFVYLELAKWNQEFAEKIENAKTAKELESLWKMLNEKAYLSYRIDVAAIDATVKEFSELSINDRKRFLLESIDQNHLYINYSEIEDKEYGVSQMDRKVSKEFYSG